MIAIAKHGGSTEVAQCDYYGSSALVPMMLDHYLERHNDEDDCCFFAGSVYIYIVLQVNDLNFA